MYSVGALVFLGYQFFDESQFMDNQNSISPLTKYSERSLRGNYCNQTYSVYAIKLHNVTFTSLLQHKVRHCLKDFLF